MADENQSMARNELRDWVKGNAPLVTVTGVMLAAAVFSRSLGPGPSVVWMVSCFVLLSLILMQEIFETFPPPQHDSGKLTAFKWVLGSAMANLISYWMLIVYKAFGIFVLGVMSVVLALNLGEWLVKRMRYFKDQRKRGRKVLRHALVAGFGLLGSFGATRGIPKLAVVMERDFLAPAGVLDSQGASARDSTHNVPAAGQPSDADTGNGGSSDTVPAKETAIKPARVTPDQPRSIRVDVVNMPVDWGQLLIAPVAALGAALLGAWLGGKTAREASTAAMREELRLEREHAIDRLHRRVKSNLRRVMALRERVASHPHDQPLEPEVGEELEVVWNLYYRVMEPIFTIGVGDLPERLDAFFVRSHTVAESVKALEARARDITTVGHETEKYRDTQEARQRLPRERRAVLEKIAELGKEAKQFLDEVQRIWPDPTS